MKDLLQDLAAFALVLLVTFIVMYFSYEYGRKDGIDEGKRLATWHNGIKGI